MIKQLLLFLSVAIFAADTAEIRPAGGLIRGGRINYTATYDADASDFFTRVVANSGTISDQTKTAVNAFVVAAKANGYWTKLTRINLFCGGELAGALVPLKVGGGGATDTNNGPFLAGNYSLATGLTGNGTTMYLDTGLLANALSANDTHLAVYNRSGVIAKIASLGALDGAAVFQALLPYSDDTCYSDQYNSVDGRVSAAATPAPPGFIVATRTAAGSHSIYRNGSSIANNATSGGSLPSRTIYIFAVNNGAAQTFSNVALGGYSTGSGFTSGNITSYNTDLEAFQDALGRGVQ